jgi:TetR/AcrR family transcriptional regulator
MRYKCGVTVLTKQLVNKKRLPGRSRGRRAGADGSRARLFAAAAAEFAAHGFAGASVDRIAGAARLNKAMIYYHFRSKAALYREILHDMFQAVGRGARAAADSAVPPETKIGLFVEAIAAEAEARPHFPPIWFREVAEGGVHLDATILRDLAAVLQALQSIVDEGARAGRFRRVNPLVVHAGIVAPMLLYFASARLRERLRKAGIKSAAMFDRAHLVDHLRQVALAVLEGRI